MLYLHIPFCTQRCVYCDFYFVTTRQGRDAFVASLCEEIRRYGELYGKDWPIDTIYFGGGTPSVLALDQLERILDAVHSHFDTSAVQETTLELNPEDGHPAYLKGLRTLGIDRLSIGIQSFAAADLTFMNRSHSPDEAVAIIPNARKAGFDNFSVDLIFGVPGQPPGIWADNLQRVIDLDVPHLSTYGLTLEPQTVLFKQVQRGLVTMTQDEHMVSQYHETIAVLQAAGYVHYETSSFARSGYRALHNQNYWTHANYLGFGPSAHAFWWEDTPRRWANVRSVRKYQQALEAGRLPIGEEETLDPQTLANEYIMLRMRTSDGLDLHHLKTRYGLDLALHRGDTLTALGEAGHVVLADDVLRLTDQGKSICDAVTTALMV